MSWRDRSETRSVDGDKPSLEAVLDHYAVQYTHRYSQMVKCPLHEDNTASNSVSIAKQVWKCHSCGEGGDSWELIKRMEDTDFDGARAFASTVGLTEGGARRGGQQLRGGSRPRRGGRSVPGGTRHHGGDGTYVPAWRRS